MAARLGISRTDVLESAIAVLREQGRPESVTLAAVAKRLGIRVQSIYAHVDGAAGLRRVLALAGLDALADVVTDAAVGAAGTDALERIVRAELRFALTDPGLFCAAILPPGDDPGLLAATDRVTRPIGRVLENLGLDDIAQVHWNRATLAAIYGFALLSRDRQLTLAVDVDETVDHLVRVLAHQPLTAVQPVV